MTAPQTANAVQLPPVPQTLQERAIAIAEEYEISTTTFNNLIFSESSWDPTKDNGADRGLLQINRTYHPEVSDECAFDPECAMRWSAQRIKDGYLYEWTPANCYSFVKTLVKVPLMRSIIPNSAPSVGVVAIFQYKVPHLAYVEKLTENGFWVKEANYEPAKITRRFIKWDDPRLKGFYAPPNQLASN